MFLITSPQTSFLSIINILILALALNSQNCLSQTKSADAVIFKTILYTAGRDMDRALQMADSVYKISNEPINKIKSLMLLADLNLTTGKKEAAMDYAFKAENIAAENDAYEWQARIYGFISTHYRTIGLSDLGKKYLTKGLEAINKVEQAHIVNQYKGLAYQELALCEIELENYEKAVKLLETAEPFLNKIKTEEIKLYQVACNYMQLGRAYMYQKKRDFAINNFNKALGLLSKIKDEATIVKGFIYEGMGRAYLEDEQFGKSILYLKKSLDIATGSDNLDLQVEVYGDLAIYYIENDDIANYKKYSRLYSDSLEESTRNNKKSLEKVVNRLQKREEDLAFKHNMMFSGFSLLSCSLVTVVWVNRKKRKKQYKMFQEVLKNLKEKRTDSVIGVKPAIVKEDDGAEKELMSKEVEDAILEKLANFEKGDAFTNNNLTLSGLSVMLETNSKYLSHVINKHKKKDFNSYINALRIYYIIKKLEGTPDYLNYKISYLADECGFSSHSKFAEKFKIVTGMSPSSFIQMLRKR